MPENYDNTKPHRLVFGIHWRTGTMYDVANGSTINPYYGLQSLAENDSTSTIFVSPDGLISEGMTGWANIDGEDITFMQTIINATDAELCIDESLRFSTGFSYGGGMSHSIACTLSKQFRAVAILSGALISGCAGGTEPVAYYLQHGISDDVLPIELGREIRDVFVKNNGCTPQDPVEPAVGTKTHILTKYEGCKEDKPVWYAAFDSDHNPIPADEVGKDKERTWTPATVWEFFQLFKSL